MRQNKYVNEALHDFVTNKNSFDYIVEAEGQLVQKSNPIYLDPYDSYMLTSHFYSPRKKLFGKYYSTFSVNIMIIWLMSIVLIITLYFDLLRKFLESFGKIAERIGDMRKK